MRRCDVLFAYMDNQNPSGYGMVLEIGYALGLGKVVVFVDESDNRYLAIAREAATVWFAWLDDGIEFLRKLRWAIGQCHRSAAKTRPNPRFSRHTHILICKRG